MRPAALLIGVPVLSLLSSLTASAGSVRANMACLALASGAGPLAGLAAAVCATAVNIGGVLRYVVEGATWILRGVARACQYIIELAEPLFTVLADGANSVTTLPEIRNLWMIFRDLANALLVVALLAAAVMVILQRGNYTVKKVLPNLVAAVLLINFSRLLIQLLIDAFHVVTVGIYQLVAADNSITEGNVLPKLIDLLDVEMILNTISTAASGESGVTNFQLFVATLVVLALMIIITFGALIILILYAERFIALGLLTVASPLAFVALVAPFGFADTMSKAFWKKLLKFASMNVILAAHLGFAIMLSRTFLSVTFPTQQPHQIATGFPQIEWGTLMNVVLVMILIVQGVKAARSGSYAEGTLTKIEAAGHKTAKAATVGATIGAAGLAARPFARAGDKASAMFKSRMARIGDRRKALIEEGDAKGGLLGRATSTVLRYTMGREAFAETLKTDRQVMDQRAPGKTRLVSKDAEERVSTIRDKTVLELGQMSHTEKIDKLTKLVEAAHAAGDAYRVKALVEAAGQLGVSFSSERTEDVKLTRRIAEAVEGTTGAKGLVRALDDAQGKGEWGRRSFVMQQALEGTGYKYKDAAGNDQQVAAADQRMFWPGQAKSRVMGAADAARRKSAGDVRETIGEQVTNAETARQFIAQYVSDTGDVQKKMQDMNGAEILVVARELLTAARDMPFRQRQEIAARVAVMVSAAERQGYVTEAETKRELAKVSVGMPAVSVFRRERGAHVAVGSPNQTFGEFSSGTVGGVGLENNGDYRDAFATLREADLLEGQADPQFIDMVGRVLSRAPAGDESAKTLEQTVMDLMLQKVGTLFRQKNIEAALKYIAAIPRANRGPITQKLLDWYNAARPEEKASVDAVCTGSMRADFQTLVMNARNAP